VEVEAEPETEEAAPLDPDEPGPLPE
jgi:hypothetical protein